MDLGALKPKGADQLLLLGRSLRLERTRRWIRGLHRPFGRGDTKRSGIHRYLGYIYAVGRRP